MEVIAVRRSGSALLDEEQGSTYMADNDGGSDEARTLRPLQAAACTYRIALGPRAGQKVLTVQGAMPRQTEFKPSCARWLSRRSPRRPPNLWCLPSARRTARTAPGRRGRLRPMGCGADASGPKARDNP